MIPAAPIRSVVVSLAAAVALAGCSRASNAAASPAFDPTLGAPIYPGAQVTFDSCNGRNALRAKYKGSNLTQASFKTTAPFDNVHVFYNRFLPVGSEQPSTTLLATPVAFFQMENAEGSVAVEIVGAPGHTDIVITHVLKSENGKVRNACDRSGT